MVEHASHLKRKEDIVMEYRNERELIASIIEKTSRHLELRAALICGAPDPIEMVKWLQPIISDPKFHGGAIPEMYFKIAAFEIRIRKEKALSKATILKN
jgi:hypothetical protein